MMVDLLRAGLCLSLFFFLCPIIHAETILLATGNKFPPFTDEKLPNGGLATEIIKKIFDELGYETEIKFLPWKRGYHSTKKNEYAGAFPYSYNEERGKDFYYSRPIYNQTFLFFVTMNSNIQYSTESDLLGLTVCKPSGYNKSEVQPFLDRKILKLYSPSDLEGCFKGLLHGRAQLTSIGEDAGWATILRAFGGKEKFRTLEKEVYRNPLHLIISKTHPRGRELLEKFNSKFDQLEKEGAIRKIIERHFR